MRYLPYEETHAVFKHGDRQIIWWHHLLCRYEGRDEVQGGIEGDVGVNENYLSHASSSVISSGLAIRFTDAFVIPRKRATDPPCIPTPALPPDIIFSSPSQPGPVGHPVSLVSAFPLTYTFSYLLSCIISLAPCPHKLSLVGH